MIAITFSPIALAVFSASGWSKSQIATQAPDVTKRSVMARAEPLRAAGDDGAAAVEIDLVHAKCL
ncbi:hypothetical protein ACVWY2_000400 [Bradyrhizobium sp. JR6.1]